MNTNGIDRAAAVQACRRTARAWRAEACLLRALAEASHLAPPQRATLRREAAAAVRQANTWLAGAGDAGQPTPHTEGAST